MTTYAKTIVEILDSGLNVMTPLKTLQPLDSSGTILRYSKELGTYGTCTFRISPKDGIHAKYTDIFKPHAFHVRIRKGTTVIWQGAIIANTKRTNEYIEVLAAEYEFYLDRILIKRTSADPNGTGQTDVYRIFNSGTMAAAFTTIMTETIAKWSSSSHLLANMTINTVENPNYPPNMTSAYMGTNGTTTYPLKGAWSFGTESATSLGPTVMFDYHTVQYILKSFGVYAYADHQIIPTSDGTGLIFNFKQFIGNNRQNNLVFKFGTQGNVVDYQIPRLGQRMANSIIGIATDNNGTVLHANESDQSSITTYGLLESVAAFSDVKNQGILQARVQAELPLVSTPNETNAIVYLDEWGPPLGQYDIGDLVTVQVVSKFNAINFNQVMRIVGITVTLNATGRERIAVQTNQPLPWQYPSSSLV